MLLFNGLRGLVTLKPGALVGGVLLDEDRLNS